ncbi:FMN-dependent NADH-azoreductase [Mesomycoplasma molare]|uniref:FMN dependent NADH:quinone oxidoreductase n=1 Tax=Mesomycoplasma molare TaxID=171288 RepID=A0ABY5TU19_9BACT|nr:FMN-dependent NADH-azoreductase [Mesomycoplasma molare]UWD34160.1 FMN-dependent NADH-azoreductase [Mesomycoplasma molare]
MKVLVIKGSIVNSGTSSSKLMTDKFMDFYKEKNPSHEIIELDLNKEKTASVSLSEAGLVGGQFWKDIEANKLVDLLKSVDKVVFSTSMVNFNYSGVVKNFIDAICIPNVTFTYKYSEKGQAKGLLDHLKVQILTSQGAPADWYPFGDFTANLKGTWEFLGANVVSYVKLAGTNVAPLQTMTAEEKVATIENELKEAASKF